MTEIELKIKSIELASHPSSSFEGKTVLERAKVIHEWLNSQTKKSIPASDNPDNFVQPELNTVSEETTWAGGRTGDKVPGHDNAVYLNTKKLYDEQEVSRIAGAREKDKSCGAMHDKEQVRVGEDQLTNYGYVASIGSPVVYVDSLPTSFHVNDILVTIKQKPKHGTK